MTGRRSLPDADLINVFEEIGRIFIDAISAGALELFAAVTAGEEADAERAGSPGRQHVPDAVAHQRSGLDVRAKPPGSGQEEIRIRFRYLT